MGEQSVFHYDVVDQYITFTGVGQGQVPIYRQTTRNRAGLDKSVGGKVVTEGGILVFAFALLLERVSWGLVFEPRGPVSAVTVVPILAHLWLQSALPM